MRHLINGVRDAVRAECWYPALALALTIPDTCGSIDTPPQDRNKRGIVEARYVAWFDKFIAHEYRTAPPHSQQFFSGQDLYRVRCKFLHEGEFEFNPGQPKQNGWAVNGIRLFVSDRNIFRSLGGAGGTTAVYQIAVKDLCEDICEGAEAWLVDAMRDPQRAALVADLGRIETYFDHRWGVL